METIEVNGKTEKKLRGNHFIGEVSDGGECWYEKVIIATFNDGSCVVVNSGCLDNYYNGDYYGTVKWKQWRQIPEKKTRPMTAQEIAMLPRGTAFIHNNKLAWYNPVIIGEESAPAYIDGINVNRFKGYRLPNETEISKFEVEE